ncbi:glycosyltransferase [Novosphingobium bradum]|uniref:Glycosyltransferase n=1 Tax=Novosphingobium bradum TaxID=1737444 RepID=A0ABV7ITF8_9SPHN
MHHARIIDQRTASPLRLLLMLGNWTGGGAERVAVHLMNGLGARGPAPIDVHLGLLHDGQAWRDQLDPARVHVAPDAARFGFERPNRELFGPGALAAAALHGPRAVRRIIAQVRPDVVMSFLKGTAILTWLALAGLPRGGQQPRPRWIVREGNNVLATADQETPARILRAASLGLTRMAYRRADAIIANASGLARDLPGQLGLDPARLHMINNPVDVAAIAEAARLPAPDLPRRPYLLAVGRLEWQKGHDLLIQAFAHSLAWRTHELVILGEGSRRDALHRQAEGLGVARRVRFAGFTANPHAWMAGADLFVLPSRWEGFPNAAAEAMAAGAPLLLADCNYGAADLVTAGVNGTLVSPGDAEALGAAIARLLANPAERAAHAAAGQQQVRRFARERILASYARLVTRVAEANAARTAPLRFAPA